MILIIAEKHSMAEKISVALGGEAEGRHFRYSDGVITACSGHLFELMDAEEYNPAYKEWLVEHLPIIPNPLKLRKSKETKNHWRIAEIRKLLKSASEVINAGDPGREGQAIVDETLAMLGWQWRTKRIWLPDLEPVEVRRAYAELRDNKEYFPLWQAAKARSHADWLVGINFSRLWTNMIREAGGMATFHVGRVQTPTLNLVLERDRQIANFVPVMHYMPEIKVAHKNGQFKATWIKPKELPLSLQADSEGRLVDRQRASSLSLKAGAQCVVMDYSSKPSYTMPPKPFSLQDLQTAASKRYHFTAKRTLAIAQSLYDTYDATTYPRTSNNYIPESYWEKAPDMLRAAMKVACLVENDTGIDQRKLKLLKENVSLQKMPAVYDNKKIGEHFAIIPTGNISKLKDMKPDERLVYNLVVERFLLQFARPHRFNTISVVLNHAGSNTNWGASGKTQIDAGWKALQAGLSGVVGDEDAEEDKDKEAMSQDALPIMSKADTVSVLSGGLAEKKTTAPKPFTDVSLGELMGNIHSIVTDPEIKKRLKEREGLGEPATRTDIIQGLIDRHYLKQFTGGKIQTTPKAALLLRSVPEDIKSPGLTAVWEKYLDVIAKGTVSYERFMQSQIEWLVTMLNEGKTMDIEVRSEEVEFLQSVRSKKKFSKKPFNSNSSKINGASSEGSGKKPAASASTEGATWLKVPFAEKDAVKRMGGKFCGQQKSWYVPAGVDVEPFTKWVAGSA